MILMAGFIAWETDRVKPKPQALGGGDTLMVRVSGYDFCPKYCEVDHFHFGHKDDYDCEEDVCEHIIYENRHK
mgnify:FL=1|tara:strand:- start:995 stop:1213 length:219 start_codon:yes stop_codon:yes gene_type:complete